MLRPTLRVLTALSAALLLAACGEDSPNATTAVDALETGDAPSSMALEKAYMAVGGKRALQDLSGFRYEASGQRFVLAEGFRTDDVTRVNSYRTSASLAASGGQLRLETERVIDFIGVTTNNTYTEIVNGNAGFLEGDEGLAAGFAPPDAPMTPARVAAVKRQQELLNPHLLLSMLARGEATAAPAGMAILDGQLHYVLEVDGIRLFVSAASGRINKLSTLEDVSPFKDSAVEAFFDDWQPATGSQLLFPRVVTMAAADEVVLMESRGATVVEALDPSLFQLPATAGATFVEAEAERGSDSHAALSQPQALGIPFRDALQTTVVAAELAPGVWHLTGGSHHSMLVEQATSLVLVEAPLDPFRTKAIADWAAVQLPGKPIAHVINTHHHEDHSAGVRQAVGLGARLLTHEAAAGFWQRVLNAPATVTADALANASVRGGVDYVAAAGSFTLPDAQNPVTAYAVANCHAADMLVIGVQNLVFLSDILNPGGGAPICPLAETLGEFDAHGIAAEMVVGGHGGTVSVAELRTQAAGG
ncbi:MAG TPA: MBL fold metallo-hydrolase [Polyangiaceae bacterium]|nr:MBL fold metallo-hydrolase [Polyangiaceae bacterium]